MTYISAGPTDNSVMKTKPNPRGGGSGQTTTFTSDEPNANDQNLFFSLSRISFVPFEVPRFTLT